MYMEKPIIAVTMGDPAGIGPEIVAKSIADKATYDVARCIVIGDKKVMEKAIKIVGADFIGHTEIFGALTGTDDPLTMFETNGLRVFFLTRHKSLRDMLDDIKKDRIIDYVERCTDALRRLGVKEGTMAVAGLNPHSGEHGLFGWEEVKEIAPAVEELKERGFNVAGPVPADSVFHQAAQGWQRHCRCCQHGRGY